MSVSISGVDKVKARLDRIRGRVFVNGETDLLRLWGLTSEALSKSLCPVDTGRLRASIGYRRIDEVTALVGTPTEYARYVEYGTVFMGAQPYLTPGCNMALREVIAKLKAYLASV